MVTALQPGDPDEISGYRLRGRLGSGGMGSVYLSHTRGGQPVALKVIRREFAENPEFRRRFAREVEAARRVQGAYTAAVLDSSTEGPQPWLASAYVPGPPLAEAVSLHGPMPLHSVLMLTAGVAEALQSVHAAGVVHRDLKPSNVLLASDGPRVIDFGIARAADATALTGTDVRLGTPAFMSPEQAEGRPAGPAIDIFALGLIAHYAATAGHPFGDGDGHALLYRIVAQEPDLTACPEQLRPVVRSCLAKDPRERPRLDDILEACLRLAEAEGVDLTRGEGWWLPQAVAAEATALETAPLPPDRPTADLLPHYPSLSSSPSPSSSPPPLSAPLSPPSRSSAPPPPAAAPYTPTEVAAEAQPPARGPGHGRRRTLVVAVAAALVVGTTAGLLIDHFTGPGGGGGPRSSSDYSVKYDRKPLPIGAPTFVYGSYSSAGHCLSNISGSGGFHGTVFVDLRTLTVHSGQEDAADEEADDSYTLRYTDCANGTYAENGDAGGAGPTSGLKLLDNRGTWGTVTDKNVSADECRDAAGTGSLAQTVSIHQIQKGSPLKKNMGVCVELNDKTVVLLWINGTTKHPDNDNLSDFSTSATQWVPKKK